MFSVGIDLRWQYPLAMLVGRGDECARLEALINRASTGGSAVVVVTGEAGIGKSRLLEYAISYADGFRILRARGVESEEHLPFAGLADLLGPVLGHLSVLPGPQGAALAGALAVGPVVAADRYAICAATLGMLAAAAAERPVLAVIDDAHWLDAASAQAVEFAARRLGEEAIGIVIAVRSGSPSALTAAGLDSLALNGLDRASAVELLSRTGRPISGMVASQLADGAGGNPLALLELSATLTGPQLAGLESLPEPLPVAAALRRAFGWRLRAASPAVRRLLVLSAADASADLATIRRAIRFMSLDLDSLPAAEGAGLVRVDGGRVEFTHPLLRSAAYHSAKPADRRAAHRALAEATDPARDPVRRAWHLAAAAVGPNDTVAESLDRAGKESLSRNAFGPASRAYQRAAELTVDSGQQVSRWMAAGQAAYLGGDPASACRLLSRATDMATDPCVKADAQAMLAQASMFTSLPLRHYHELLAEAESVLPFDKRRAATLLALATGACLLTGKLPIARETAQRAAQLCQRADGAAWLISQGWYAYITVLTGDRRAGRRRLDDFLADPRLSAIDPAMRILRILASQVLAWCEDYQDATELLNTTVERGRALGLLADLPYGLAVQSELKFRTSDWGQAYADAAEAAELAADFASKGDQCFALTSLAQIEAAMGADQACRAHLRQALSIARSAGIEPTRSYAAATLGLLELGSANYQQAAAELTRAAAFVVRNGLADPNVIQWRPDFIESLARLRRLADARQQLAMLDAEAASTGSGWALMTAARCRGILQDNPSLAIRQLDEAVDLADASASMFEQARARLCLGQAMRRARLRADARRPLDQAYAAFELLGARPWTDRTAAELAATGITSAPRRTPIHGRLTPQELRVARLVSEGLTNQEVATRLFLSPKTIEVHLSHIYDKLAVHSRAHLTRLITVGVIPR